MYHGNLFVCVTGSQIPKLISECLTHTVHLQCNSRHFVRTQTFGINRYTCMFQIFFRHCVVWLRASEYDVDVTEEWVSGYPNNQPPSDDDDVRGTEGEVPVRFIDWTVIKLKDTVDNEFAYCWQNCICYHPSTFKILYMYS